MAREVFLPTVGSRPPVGVRGSAGEKPSTKRKEMDHMEIFDSIIIGAGQAGLAMSASLRLRGIRHVVLERGGCRAMAQRAMGFVPAAEPQLADAASLPPLPRKRPRWIHDRGPRSLPSWSDMPPARRSALGSSSQG